ncbi:hypothetical protein Tco_0894756 [Tanacetum coccineum]|uniref:Reverse transcriptase N-terminal domain-containing protein n=1 Tax=Tanacetum coccineum TaxID=301880 RepID=A0ABQ5CIY1_9ASTR
MVATPANNSIRSVLNRVIVATTVYYLWQIRNKRVFTKKKRDEQIMTNTITDNIRMQLLSFKVKNSAQIKNVEESWNRALYLDLQNLSTSTFFLRVVDVCISHCSGKWSFTLFLDDALCGRQPQGKKM